MRDTHHSVLRRVIIDDGFELQLVKETVGASIMFFTAVLNTRDKTYHNRIWQRVYERGVGGLYVARQCRHLPGRRRILLR